MHLLVRIITPRRHKTCTQPLLLFCNRHPRLCCSAMLAAVLGKDLQAEAAAAARRKALSVTARNAAVAAEAYPESEAHAGRCDLC